MEALNIEATEDTPKIVLDAGSGNFEFSGTSIPEDAVSFYKPVFDWLTAYAEAPKKGSNFNFNLEYFNTASSKVILDIFLKIDEVNGGDNGFKITWHFDEEDEDMEEAGEEYADLVDVDFELKSYS